MGLVAGAITRLFSALGTMLVGAMAGASVLALGTKALVLVPLLAFAAVMAAIPYSPLLSIVFTIPINVEIAGPITVSRLIIIFGFFVAILQYLKGTMPRFSIPWPEGVVPLLFFSWVFFIGLVVPGGSLVSRVGAYIVHATIFFVILSYTDSTARLRAVFLTLVVTGIGQGVLAVLEAKFNFAPFGGWHATLAEMRGNEVRVVATSSHPIILAGFFLVVISATTMFLLTAKAIQARLTFLAILLLCLAGWWLTYSRSSWMGMAMMVLISMLLVSRPTRILALIGGTVGFVLLATHGFSLSAVIETVEGLATLKSASKTAGVTSGSESLTWRQENWAAAFSMWAQNPVTGVGIEQSNPNMTRYLADDALAHVYIGTASPHNMFLMIASEGGTPSIVLFVTMWLMAVYGVWRAWDDPALRPYAIAVAAMIVGHVTTFFFNPLAREAFVIIALGLTLGRIARQRREAAAPPLPAPHLRPRTPDAAGSPGPVVTPG